MRRHGYGRIVNISTGLAALEDMGGGSPVPRLQDGPQRPHPHPGLRAARERHPRQLRRARLGPDRHGRLSRPAPGRGGRRRGRLGGYPLEQRSHRRLLPRPAPDPLVGEQACGCTGGSVVASSMRKRIGEEYVHEPGNAPDGGGDQRYARAPAPSLPAASSPKPTAASRYRPALCLTSTKATARSARRSTVTPDAQIVMHRIRSDQQYHHYLGELAGGPDALPDGTGKVVTVGSDLAAGQRPQLFRLAAPSTPRAWTPVPATPHSRARSGRCRAQTSSTGTSRP